MILDLEDNQTFKVNGFGLIKTGIIEIGRRVWNGSIKNIRNEEISCTKLYKMERRYEGFYS
jgi:hypothetical protein